jgi:hypothetical protein
VNARQTDPWTSHDAANSMIAAAKGMQAKLLDAYRAHPGGLTDEEAAAAAGLALGAWKRCSELRTKGLITWTGATRVASSGRHAQVCVLSSPSPSTLFPMPEEYRW